MMPLRVFGVVREGHPSPSSRVDDSVDTSGVRLVSGDGLAAVVEEYDEQVGLTEDDATRHLDVLIMLLRDGPVLPFAFGTVSPDDDAVRTEVLEAAAHQLRPRLDAVDGQAETRLEVFFDESRALGQVIEASPDLRGLAAEARGGARLDTRIALGEAVSAQLSEWRRRQAEAMLPALTAVTEGVAELESSEPLQQRWAFLVSVNRLPELDEAVERLRSSLGERAVVEYIGPLPVYSFLEETGGEPPPARSAWGW